MSTGCDAWKFKSGVRRPHGLSFREILLKSHGFEAVRDRGLGFRAVRGARQSIGSHSCRGVFVCVCPLVAQQLVPLTGGQESGCPLECLPQNGQFRV